MLVKHEHKNFYTPDVIKFFRDSDGFTEITNVHFVSSDCKIDIKLETRGIFVNDQKLDADNFDNILDQLLENEVNIFLFNMDWLSRKNLFNGGK